MDFFIETRVESLQKLIILYSLYKTVYYFILQDSDDPINELNKTFQGLSSPSKDDRTSDSSFPWWVVKKGL